MLLKLPTREDFLQILLTGDLSTVLEKMGFYLTGSTLPAFNRDSSSNPPKDVDYFIKYTPELERAFINNDWNRIPGKIHYSDSNLKCVYRLVDPVYKWKQIDVQLVKDPDLKLLASKWLVDYLARQGKFLSDVPKEERSELWDIAYWAVTNYEDPIRSENKPRYPNIGGLPPQMLLTQVPVNISTKELKVACVTINQKHAYLGFLRDYAGLQALLGHDCKKLKKSFSGDFGGYNYSVRVLEYTDS